MLNETYEYTYTESKTYKFLYFKDFPLRITIYIIFVIF